MISADVKANKSNKKKRSGDCISQIFIIEIQCKTVKGIYIFHLILVGILSILILPLKNRVVRGHFLLTGQNLSSVTVT